MITPIGTLNINQIAERKDDLLMSSKDIEELAKNVREKVIDKFAERLTSRIKTEIDDCTDELDWINEIAEEMRGAE